jgi:hypothetical protein
MSAVLHPLGIVSGMPNAEYHALTEAVGSTGLRRLAKSPLHFFGATLDPDRPAASEPTAAMFGGTLTHCALLEPHALDTRYVVKPPGHDGRTREGKAWLETVGGREAISAQQLASSLHQAQMMRALPEIGGFLATGEAEVSAFWVDKRTGVFCKCRPDWVSPRGDRVVLLDVKTTQDASPRGFARSVWNYRYDLQAAFYSEGFEQASGLMVMGFVLVAVETEWPHACASYMIDDADMERARDQNHELLELYRRCQAVNSWPGYSNTITPISLPAWAHTAN